MKKISLFFLISLITTALYSQKALKKGNEAFDKLEYYEAIGHYEVLLAKETVPEATENLAHCYRFLRRSDKAEFWYKKALEQNALDPNNTLYLAQALLSNGKPGEAQSWAQRYADANPSDPRGRNILEAINQREKLLNPKEKFTVSACPFNLAENDDFAPFLSGKNLYFTSDRGNYDGTTGWSGRSYTRLFQTGVSQNNVEPTPGNINSVYHDGAACIDNNGRTMYFTRNNVSGKKKLQGTDHTVHLILVKAVFDGSKWQLEGEFPYNSPEYNVAYPTLSSDGNTLVFASDAPGGEGGMDLYRSLKDNAGNWSLPENLGAKINTPGAETYPFLMQDGSLIFSSDGLPGMGGMDLFWAEQTNGLWSNAQNLGAPLNSLKDEFGFWSRTDLAEGWFSSNRNSTQALYDIFYFNKNKAPNRVIGLVVDKYTQIPLKGVEVTAFDLHSGQQFTAGSANDGQFAIELPAGKAFDLTISGVKNGIATSEGKAIFYPDQSEVSVFVQLEHNDPRFTLEGYSLSSKDQKPIEGTLVKLLNTGNGETKTAYSDKNGKYTFQLDQRSDYRITGEKNGYYSTVANASTKNYDRSTTLYVNLFLYTQVVIINEDITLKNGKNPMNINDIYYDFDDHNIRADAAYELNKLVAFLELNKNLKVVQLSAHTDSRGSTNYNQKLSERRAEAAVSYLVSKGIDRRRLRYQGFGETRLVNRCGDSANCTETEHQQNRRTELRVLEIND
ncbi:MAG: hypothetical protein DHS20C18_48680 [Saprospiraceae bacterium]|nr:MAG: hypothetical protein DHS20C18_48680 [Saprospiraceae bacterium]